VSHHLLDSLAVLPHLPPLSARCAARGCRVGRRLPGIPVALARPEWHVTLIESNQKKAAFLRQAVIELGLANVEVMKDAPRPGSRRALRARDSRAFAELGAFIAACRHLLARAACSPP